MLIDDDLIVYSYCVFIPTSLRPTMLSHLHEAHQGISQFKIALVSLCTGLGTAKKLTEALRDQFVAQLSLMSSGLLVVPNLLPNLWQTSSKNGK